MKSSLTRVYSPKQLAARVTSLGRDISRDYAGKTVDVVLMLENAFVFGADLLRQISGQVVCHFVRTEIRDIEFGGHQRREIYFSRQPRLAGRDVLVVDAVVQSGLTQDFLIKRLQESRPRSLRLATLFDKPAERRMDLKADYFCFEAASKYLAGYGLAGSRGWYRNLPYVGLQPRRVPTQGKGRGSSQNRSSEVDVNSSSTAKTILFWMFIILLCVVLWHMVSASGQSAREEEPSYSDFVAQMDRGNIKEVTLYLSPNSYEIEGEWREPSKKFRTTVFKEAAPDLTKQLQDKGVLINVKEVTRADWVNLLLTAAPLLLLAVFWVVMMRQMQAGGNKALSFGKSRARLLTAQQKKATFKDVAGIDEAKEELQEIIDFLKDPQKFQKLGGRIPKGVLLVGPPGTGKTLLARAIAGEANVPFFSISGSDFVEMFVGVGASRVRDLFEQGKKNAPCIIFIDEIDAVGRHRGAGLGGGHDEREQTLNALLVEMDGFESNEGVILIAATNRPDVLDPALLRPGRFDRRVVVPRPDIKGREEILHVHTRKVPVSDDVDLSVIARGTPGFSGADLANLVNEAALWAARQNRKLVTMSDFEMSKDKVLMGVERKSMILSDEEKKNTAYHEAGHALVAAMTAGADPLHKVTIIPRGMALGLTMQLPIDDKHTYTKDYLLGTLTVLMGGRSAEEIFLGHITTGAGNDIERATDIARKMVCDWGMSDLGPLAFGKKEEAIFLGREIAQHRDYSEDTAIKIDGEVRRIVTTSYSTARSILETNRETLERIALALLEREVLDATELKLLMDNKPLPEKVTPAPPQPPAPPVPGVEAKPVGRPELRPAPGFSKA